MTSEPSSLRDEGETEDERIERNWSELLQELRVTQTGTQILTGFLLTIPFQQRFSELTELQRDLYLALVALSALATMLGLAPVSLHRTLFRQGAKDRILRAADVLVRLTLAAVALVLTGTVLLIVDVVTDLGPAIVASAVTLVLTVGLWVLLPRWIRPRRGERRDD